MKEAEQLCQDTGDKKACYHLACQFEISGNIPKSIHFFSRAQCYSNAIRLAKEKQLDQELMNLSMLSTQEDMPNVPSILKKKEVWMIKLLHCITGEGVFQKLLILPSVQSSLVLCS
ncbi:intraflagellar transport protein 140 homolog isoform X2 [Hydra vulgaris]|uniref:Intraflagellar transport protein 140 homolog isoform X2 n=1 Tax=Hydra vulgaris TaxID=6087 RepID=A0ABM4CEG9_HYDVU